MIVEWESWSHQWALGWVHCSGQTKLLDSFCCRCPSSLRSFFSSGGTSIFANDQLDVITGQIRRLDWDAFDQWNEDQSYAFVFSFLCMIHPAKKVVFLLRQALFFSFKSYPARKQKWYLLRSLLSPWSKTRSRIYRKSPNSLTFNNASDLSRSCSMVRKTSDRVCRNQYRFQRSC